MDLRCLPALLLLLTTGAIASEPLYVKNLSPVAGLLGLPSQRNADIAAAGSFDLALHGSVASHYMSETNSDEYLNLDGETGRVALELRYSLLDALDLQLEVPWLNISGGDLDKLIDDWHDVWGMPDGGRPSVPRNLLDYRYANRAGAGFSLQDSA